MKKIFTLLAVCFIAVANVKAQYVTIPDATFKAYLQTKYPTAFNGAGKMDTTNSLVVNEDSLDCSNTTFNSIHNLSGIQFFKNLVYLNASGNNLTTIPYIASTLKGLYLGGNVILSLPTFPNTLRELNISGVSAVFTSVYIPSVLPDSLKILSANYTSFSNLPNLPNGLKELSVVGNNVLTCLPKLPATLKILGVENKITCLPNIPNATFTLIIMGGTMPIAANLAVCNATNNPNNCPVYPANYVNIPDTSFGKFLLAQYPSCLYKDASNLYWMDTTCNGVVSTAKISWASNFTIKNIEGIQYFKNLDSLSIVKFSQLDSIHQLPANLKYLKTVSCLALKVFDSLPVTLTSFNCDTNNLSKLPILPNGLQYLSCRFNFLHNTITSLPTALTYFDCSDNITTTLPSSLPNSLQTLIVARNAGLQCLPQLPNTLTQLNAANTQVACLPNMPTSLTTSLSVCNATNNPNNCTIYPANYVNIPDTAFGKFLLAQYPSCLYKDASNLYWMDTTCSGVVNETSLSCNFQNINDLTGIQYFKNMNRLECSHNELINLQLLPNTIKWLDCGFNKLNNLPTLPPILGHLDCGSNLLTGLPVLPSNLSELYCPYNKITGLPQLPNLLLSLECEGNNITTIPALPNSLQLLNCQSNKLSTLPTLTNNLYFLGCGSNQLTSLPNLPPSIVEVECDHNLLTSIPTLPNGLGALFCMNNQITVLPTLPNTLKSLLCYATNIQCLPMLPSTLTKLALDQSKIKCLPNGVLGLMIIDSFFNQITLPICNATNNPNNCPVYPANYVNIPDTSFGKFLLAQYPSCLYKDASNLYWMDTTCSGVVGTTKINWASNFLIKNIEGIQYFKNLDSLGINNFSKLDSIHQLPANLKYLKTVSCLALKVFDSLPVTLTSFNCDTNNISKLPILPNGLQYLSCRFNFLHNTITSLPTALTYFDCSDNITTTLPSSLPNSLQTLIVARNAGIQCLPQLPNTLTQLNAANTQVACLPNMPTSLTTSLSVCNATNNPNNCTVYPPNYVNIPDTNFGNFLLAQYPSCLYKDASNFYWMDTTCSGVVNATTLNCGNIIKSTNRRIQSLEGVQYFKNLSGLTCSFNSLTSLPSLSDALRFLNCDSNMLTNLPSLPNKVAFITCNNNKLNGLPSLPDSLKTLYCESNQLSILPTLPDSLIYLNCENNKLDSLPTLPNSLKFLYCGSNFLTHLPALNIALNVLDCGYNKLNNLPALPNSLTGLYCGSNFLTHLPPLSNTLITIIHCYNNQLSTLPILPNNLGFLDVSDNHMYCLPKLPSSLKFLFNSNTNINCIPNLVTGLYIYPSSLSICNPTNNINQCKSFPTVAGRVFTDNNSNGVKDANEFYRPFVKELASNGNATFSNLDGAFTFSFDSTGSYSLKTIAPKYFKAVPDSNSFNFGINNIYFTVPDIALQPTAVKDSLAIVVTTLNSRARPGFSFPYHLGYANAGTTNLYTTVSFTYDTSRLIYDSSSVAIISNTNNTIVISTDSLIAGQGKYAQLYFTVKPTAVIGDSLFAVANAVSSATTATSANATIIRGSFDPNDKIATPQLTPTQVANGDWIEYTIRFQNTGNDTAVNVVLADTLSFLLQQGQFNVVATSHLANLTYSYLPGNVVYFEFLNINLPDSATNFNGSQGWVTFKVKPLAGVAVGTYIDNKASIYFDYNKPIVTNVARTLISTIVPVKLLSYELRLVNEATRTEKQVTNIWATANEINASHFNIQRSIDGINFKTVGQVAAKGGGSYNFTDPLTINNLPSTIFYRLQMVDKDGRFEYSPIKQINLQPSKSNIRLYPNPAKDIVTIECANAKEILITDYLGKRILNKKVINNQSSIINLQGFTRGIYLVQVVLDNGSIVNEKLIVE